MWISYKSDTTLTDEERNDLLEILTSPAAKVEKEKRDSLFKLAAKITMYKISSQELEILATLSESAKSDKNNFTFEKILAQEVDDLNEIKNFYSKDQRQDIKQNPLRQS